MSNNTSAGKKKCPHCDKGFHNPDNCWTKYPEKRPTSQPAFRKPTTQDKTNYKAKYFALVDKLIVDDATNDATPLNE